LKSQPYNADRIDVLGEFHSSPGMVSESFTMVRAHGLKRIGEGGGVDGENIIVHRIRLDQVTAFIASKRSEGCAIDAKLLMLVVDLEP
jgi:ADP-ribose pyrophosphatase